MGSPGFRNLTVQTLYRVGLAWGTGAQPRPQTCNDSSAPTVLAVRAAAQLLDSYPAVTYSSGWGFCAACPISCGSEQRPPGTARRSTSH